jgi:hypothetical protein
VRQAKKLLDYLIPLPLFAVLRGITPAEIPAIGESLTAEGFRILEVPLNSPQPYESIARLARDFGEHCLIGAGTVIDPAQVVEVKACTASGSSAKASGVASFIGSKRDHIPPLSRNVPRPLSAETPAPGKIKTRIDRASIKG